MQRNDRPDGYVRSTSGGMGCMLVILMFFLIAFAIGLIRWFQTWSI